MVGRDPLIYLTGGPGGTAIASAAPLVQLGINHDRDVIFVDQRGTLPGLVTGFSPWPRRS